VTRWSRLLLVGLFVGGGTAWLLAGELLALVMGRALPAAQLAGWAAWFTWQGTVFPRARRALMGRYGDDAYRRAFFRHILPGVTFGAAQMARPLAHGVTAALLSGPAPARPGWAAAIGSALVLDGLVLLSFGFATIGAAAAGFLYEYVDHPEPLRRMSIYTCIRHPLFLGGALWSFGTALAIGTGDVVALGLINVAIVPVYCRVEDSRLIRSFGEPYAAYAAAVNGVVPRLPAVRAFLASGPASWRGAGPEVASMAQAEP